MIDNRIVKGFPGEQLNWSTWFFSKKRKAEHEDGDDDSDTLIIIWVRGIAENIYCKVNLATRCQACGLKGVVMLSAPNIIRLCSV